MMKQNWSAPTNLTKAFISGEHRRVIEVQNSTRILPRVIVAKQNWLTKSACNTKKAWDTKLEAIKTL